MNVEKILEVADAIESSSGVCLSQETRLRHQFPTKGPIKLGFNMQVWGPYNSHQYADRSGHNCGTVACIGGWTNAIWGPEEARTQLGLTTQQENELFYMYGCEISIESPKVTNKRAAAVLRHLAKTDVVAWDNFDKYGKPIT